MGRKKLDDKLNQFDYEVIMCQIDDMVDKVTNMNRVIIKGYGLRSLQANRVNSLITKLNELQESIEQDEEIDPLWTKPENGFNDDTRCFRIGVDSDE